MLPTLDTHLTLGHAPLALVSHAVLGRRGGGDGQSNEQGEAQHA